MHKCGICKCVLMHRFWYPNVSNRVKEILYFDLSNYYSLLTWSCTNNVLTSAFGMLAHLWYSEMLVVNYWFFFSKVCSVFSSSVMFEWYPRFNELVCGLAKEGESYNYFEYDYTTKSWSLTLQLCGVCMRKSNADN